MVDNSLRPYFLGGLRVALRGYPWIPMMGGLGLLEVGSP